jgi:nuclear GTP-binding protein
MLESETFANTFGPKAQRKRPKVLQGSVDELATSVTESAGKFNFDFPEIII